MMLDQLRAFFDHSRHKLSVRDLAVDLDVLAFEAEEQLSQPFRYVVEFTSSDHDIAAEQMLGQTAHFTLHAAHGLPIAVPRLAAPQVKPLRTLHGVITAFTRLSGSNDEARYEITLQPRLSLLDRGRQFRIYQNQSVPQIVESVLRSRHDFEGQDFLFELVREYPKREQVMQYGESDLAFVARLLAEVGIWYRFTSNERLNIDVVEFHDDQRHYARPRIELAYRSQSGLGSSGQDGVWGLQASHQVVERNIHFRAYHSRDAKAWLDGDVDQTRGAKSTYGEAYHYAEPYTVLGDKLDQDEDLQSESGFFYARLRHERYLNAQTRLIGVSSSATLALSQVLAISGGAPQAFAPGAVITGLQLRAARDRSLETSFDAMPYSDAVCFRPPLLTKPHMAGTIPARISSSEANDPYSHIDMEGRYKVNFLFDRDSWKIGMESMWLRLARPYAGDTHGLHLPLICGTEVAVAFEQGDPDRPYIAHALHDSQHPDHVTLARRDYKRNVLRTPANNKLRMEDARGQEHIKLSTEHGGKSQLNLGHLVDAKKHKRGEGFELRTDGWGAIRGGKGIFISAEGQARAQGHQLDMRAAVERLQKAGEQLQQLSDDASVSQADPADVQAQLNLLKKELDQLKTSVLLLSAPQGVALTSGKHLQLAAQDNLMLNAGGQADMSVVKKLFMGVGQGLSLFVRKVGLKLIANEGPVTMQAQNDRLELLARQGLSITSTEDEIHITAKKRIVLNAAGSYIALEACSIESGTAGDYMIKAADFNYSPKASQEPQIPGLPPLLDIPPALHAFWPGFSGGGALDHVPAPKKAAAVDETEALEEEEEEEHVTEEPTEGITLRLGLFFDGTGNNQANAAITERCQRTDLSLYDAGDLRSIVTLCKQYGYDGFDGEMFGHAPDNSYGNSTSNVALLYDLYPDHATDGLPLEARIGYIKTYMEGIGTQSGGNDSILNQASGVGKTGVVARVKQAPDLVKKELERFRQANLGVAIRRIEVDIFGFSRGAAAARHCANELLKPKRGVFGSLLQPGRFGLMDIFDPALDIQINLIGLFDTVAAIVNPSVGDLSASNAHNPGVNLYLPPGCARQVVQLGARDELREHFALNSVLDDHREISLPGVHSDIGGGYRPLARERLWVTSPSQIQLSVGQTLESHPDWLAAKASAQKLHASGRYGSENHLIPKAWLGAPSPHGRQETVGQNYWTTVVLDRKVCGELALIALRVMRELGVRYGVPFDVIDDNDRRFRLPEDLQSIAARILEQVAEGDSISLDPEQEALLRERYIHCSAHWVSTGGLFLSKPAPHWRRRIYPNKPQNGYPQ